MSKNRRYSRPYDSHPQQRSQRELDPNRPIDLIVRQPYYDMIDKGIKTIEGRVAYRSLAHAQEGTPLTFRRHQADSRRIQCGTEWVLRADTFEDALIEVEWQKAIPTARTLDEALDVYERIYPAERVQQIGGVILLGFNKQGVIDNARA